MSASLPETASEVRHTPEDDLAATQSADLTAPLYVAWQITNECNLACMHCIEESGPGKAFKDELDRDEIMNIIDQLDKAAVPYMSFSGGEPMLHPHFTEMVERAAGAGIQVKVETNGHYITPEKAAWFKRVGVRAVQISLDGGEAGSHNKMRVHGRFDTAVEACRTLTAAGVPLEINFVPARFNIEQVGQAVDLAHDVGAFSFYSGKIMYTGNAVKTWKMLEPTEAQYAAYFDTLRAKAVEYEGKMRVYYHEMGILEEVKYRQTDPAALFIILPNGKVKLINALPFICGDLRSENLDAVWRRFLGAWSSPKVDAFVKDLEKDPAILSKLHKLELV